MKPQHANIIIDANIMFFLKIVQCCFSQLSTIAKCIRKVLVWLWGMDWDVAHLTSNLAVQIQPRVKRMKIFPGVWASIKPKLWCSSLRQGFPPLILVSFSRPWKQEQSLRTRRLNAFTLTSNSIWSPFGSLSWSIKIFT